MKTWILTSLIAFMLASALASADTFKHRKKDIVYHGYATENMVDNRNVVFTQEKGQMELDLDDFTVEYNALGRNPYVAQLSIPGGISLEHETKAFEEAIVEEANKGPLLILIEIDTPGGRVDLAKRIVAAIKSIKHCQTVAFIEGGETGGAISAGAVISLACDKIYMVPESNIGAATMITRTAQGTTDMKGAYGEVVGEKYNSAWRGYVGSIAQGSNRPGALAKAMADKDIIVVEVKRDGKSYFIEQSDKLAGDQEIRTVCRKGELLTLSAKEAHQCQIADGVVDSQQALLAELGHNNAEVKKSQHQAEAKEEFEKVERKFDKLKERLDLKFREIHKKNTVTKSQAKKDLLYLKRNTEYLLNLKRAYPDIKVDEEILIALLNEVKAEYEAVKSIRPH